MQRCSSLQFSLPPHCVASSGSSTAVMISATDTLSTWRASVYPPPGPRTLSTSVWRRNLPKSCSRYESEMLCRWLMPASVTGPFPPCMARSSIAVTANRPLVVSLMVAPCEGTPNTRLIRSSIPNPEGIDQLFVDHLGPQAKLPLGVFALRLKVFNLIQNQLDTLIHLDAVIEQALDRLGQWVILRLGSHGVGGESQLRRLLLAGLILLVENDPRRGPHRGRAGGDVFHDHGVRTDFRTLPDDDGPEHLRPRADDDPLPERRVALALVPRCPAQRHAVVQGAIVPQFRGLADHHPHAVVDEHAAADFRARMNLDAGEKTRDVRHEAGEPAHPDAPQPVRQAMNQERVKTGIAGDDFPGRTRRRVAFEYAGYVFANSSKHRDSRDRCPALSETLVIWSTISWVQPCRPRPRACPAEC